MDVLDKTGIGTLWSICKTKFALAGHTHTKVGDGSIIIYPMASNEVNFGGSNKGSTIYFGYRKMDDRPVPTNFVFGGIGTATLTAAKFKGALEGNASTASNASKVNGHTVNADVPSGAKFTDTNTWRGIQDNLTSTSTSDSLSANQGKVLKGLVDGKANSSHTHTWSQVTGAPSTATRWPSWGEVTGKPSSFTPSSHTHDDRYYTESEINSKLAAKAVNITLDTNADLNKIIAPGFYNCGGSNSILNKPSEVDAIGLIVTHNAGGNYYTQILTTSSNKNTYRRTCLNGTWSAWTQDKYTDTNTWRGIQNNLTSNSTSDSLSAAQGKVLKGLIDSKANSSDLSSYAKKNEVVKSVNIMSSGDTHSGFTPTIIVEGGNGSQTSLTIDKASSSINGLMSIKDKNKLDFFDTSKVKNGVDVSKLFTAYGLTPILPNYGIESMSVAFNTVGGDMPSFEIVAAKADVAGLMSSKDKIKLDGIQSGANKYTLPVTSENTLGGIKTGYIQKEAHDVCYPVSANKAGDAFVMIPDLYCTNGLIEKLTISDPNTDDNATYYHDGIEVNDSKISFPKESGTFATTSDCLSFKKGSAYLNSINGFGIDFTSAQQIVLLDASNNYNISDWYNQSSIGNVLDMYPCGLMGGKLYSGNYKNLFKVMQLTQGGPKLTSINDFELKYNVHVRLIHIDGGVLVCPYTLNY